MAYIGIGPASFTNNLTNVQILDDIKAGFNGSTTTFNLTSSSIPFHAVSDRALMVILGGVIQAPGVDYTINLAQITFTTAPVSGLTFYARNIYGLNALNGVNDGIVVPASLSTGGPSWDTSGNTTISGNLTVQGATTTIQSTTLDVIDKDIKLASNQSTNAGIDTAGLLWGTTAVKLKYYNNGGTNPGLNIEGTKVGLGVTAPIGKLHIFEPTQGNNVIQLNSGDGYPSVDRGLDIKSGAGGYAGARWIFDAVSSGGQLDFQTTSTSRLLIDQSGHITPGAAGTQDLGSTSKEFRHIYHGDSGKAFFGLDQDLSVYHNNSHAFINNSTGNLNLQTSGNVWIENQGGTKVWIKAIANGSVELYDNNIKTFQTDANGIRVLGPDGGVGNIELFADRGDDNADKWRFQTSATASELSIQNYVNGSWETSIKATGNSHTELYCANEKMFQTNGDGAEFFDSDNNFNLYFTCNGTRRGYIFVDSTNGGKMSFMDPQNHTLLSGTKNSSVDLYHDNTLRLQTSSTGISVTGEVAATQDYPTIKPTLDLNFAATKTLDPRFEYHSYGPASYVDENGKVVFVTAGTPRFDHDPVTRECKGLLIEGERTNKLLYSFDSGKWVAGSGGTLTRDAGIAPDGTNTATKAAISSNDIDTSPKVSGTNGSSGQVTVSASVTYTLSVWVKASTAAQVGNNFKVRIKRVSGDAFHVETTFALTGNWARYSVTGTTPANVTNIMCYVGGVSGSEALVWGAQLESGTTPSSLIPTYGYQVTRGPDVLQVTGEEFTDFYNQEQGTIFLSASYETDARSVANVTIDDISAYANYTEIGYRAGGASSGDASSYIRTTAGNDQYYKNWASSVTQGNEFKIALGYKDDNYASSTNGSTVHTDTSGTTHKTYDRLKFSEVHTVGHGGVGHYRRLMYYSKKLTNSQLVTLTS